MRLTISELMICAVITALLGLLVYSGMQKEKEWEIYRDAYDCRVVGTIKGQTSTGLMTGSNGKMMTGVYTESDRKIYQCANGTRHER